MKIVWGKRYPSTTPLWGERQKARVNDVITMRTLSDSVLLCCRHEVAQPLCILKLYRSSR